MRNALRRRVGGARVVFGVAAPLTAAALLVAVPAAGAKPGQPVLSRGSAQSAQAGRQTGATSAAQRLAAISGKVGSLIGQMTLAEKFGQLEMSGPTGPNGTPGQTLLDEVKAGQVGSVLDLVGVANINQVQQAALQSRLHIPVIFSLDVIHGYKTLFPVPIGEASSWDPAAVQNDEAISADEATADGIKWTFNPMVDISRDPRWGRVVEGAGEDPFLGSAIAAAKVRGYQGGDFSALNKMAATVKHFAAYGAPAAGREYNTVDMSEQQLRNIYLPPYKAAVDAGAASVMSAFNSLNGVPASGNPYLLSTILRQEWGFGGTVVSDYQAIQELEDFGFATNGADAARLALTAGVDIEMGVQVPSQFATYPAYGPDLVKSGKVSMARVNELVRHVLTLKFLAGMFDHPLTDPNRVNTAELTPANLAAARTMAARSLVLLNNSNNALPLSPSTSSVAVVGPLADNPSDQLGPDVPIGYSATDLKSVVSVLNGVKSAVPGATVNYAQGLRHRVHVDLGVRRGGERGQCVRRDRRRGRRTGRGLGRGVLAERHQPARAAACARAGDRGDGQAVRRGADERPAVDPRLAGRQRAGPARILVPRHRRRQRGGGRAVRQGEPGRETADELPAKRRPDPHLLQRAADRPALRSEQQVHVEVPRRAQHTAVPVRIRAVVHHVRAVEPAPVGEQRPGGRRADRHRGHHQHGQQDG
ncbi:MAG TPA: glycoside hydrolase family 3 N-terminal domain-containing protein [Streptosporangiaceae bacterium]|nr:glycoside hydrolase family 3 N-terminal domain-containing protein [Streptosporangiaceae bacterium]